MMQIAENSAGEARACLTRKSCSITRSLGAAVGLSLSFLAQLSILPLQNLIDIDEPIQDGSPRQLYSV